MFLECTISNIRLIEDWKRGLSARVGHSSEWAGSAEWILLLTNHCLMSKAGQEMAHAIYSFTGNHVCNFFAHFLLFALLFLSVAHDQWLTKHSLEAVLGLPLGYMNHLNRDIHVSCDTVSVLCIVCTVVAWLRKAGCWCAGRHFLHDGATSKEYCSM